MKSKNIKQFKKALLSNTEFIKQDDKNVNIEDNSVNKNISESIIDSDILEKFELLANFEKTDKKTLINNALNHFLRLKGAQLELAEKQKADDNK